LDGVTIEFGYPDGSGVHCNFLYNGWPERLLHIIVHEIGHWLLGGPHPYSIIRHAIWGMLSNQFSSDMCANTYEREHLDWLDPVPLTSPADASLSDFITTGLTYKFHPPGGAANEYYMSIG
jgi:hypothetical protein